MERVIVGLLVEEVGGVEEIFVGCNFKEATVTEIEFKRDGLIKISAGASDAALYCVKTEGGGTMYHCYPSDYVRRIDFVEKKTEKEAPPEPEVVD